MNLSLLHILNVLSITLEVLFKATITTVVVCLIAYDFIKSIDWADVADRTNTIRNQIGSNFVYSY